MNKRNLAVIKAASRDETRYTLNCVAFEESGATVATNGHWLAAHLPDGKLSESAGSVRAVELSACLALEKAIGKGEAKIDGEFFALDSGARLPAPDVHEHYGEFPDWRAILPSATERGKSFPTAMTRLDARYLRDLCDMAIKAGAKELDITLRAPGDVVEFNGECREGGAFGSVLALLMPVRK